MSNSRNPWQAFESVSGTGAVLAEWRARLGPEYEAAKVFLRPNGKLAASYPCAVPGGCGCEHDVVIHGPEDIVALCHCERGCETFPLKRSDIVVYELDRAGLDTAVAEALGLLRETDTTTDLRGTTRIGVYCPYAGFRFPVYLTIQMEPDDFDDVVDGLLARNEGPFINHPRNPAPWGGEVRVLSSPSPTRCRQGLTVACGTTEYPHAYSIR